MQWGHKEAYPFSPSRRNFGRFSTYSTSPPVEIEEDFVESPEILQSEALPDYSNTTHFIPIARKTIIRDLVHNSHHRLLIAFPWKADTMQRPNFSERPSYTPFQTQFIPRLGTSMQWVIFPMYNCGSNKGIFLGTTDDDAVHHCRFIKRNILQCMGQIGDPPTEKGLKKHKHRLNRAFAPSAGN